MNESKKSQSLLRKALFGNAIFSFLCADACLLASEAVGKYVGLPASEVFALGINLAVFAALLVFLVTRRDLGRGWIRNTVLAVIAMDVLWVVGSAAALLAPSTPLTGAGKWVVFAVAIAVADFAYFQFVGWRRMQSARHSLAEATS